MAQPPRASGSHSAAAAAAAQQQPASAASLQQQGSAAQPQQQPQQQQHSAAAQQQQHADLDALATLAASPSPSPALSAYSYGSSASGDDELAALSLDDWAYPHRRRSSAGSAASGPPDPLDGVPDAQLLAELRDASSAAGSGVATPIAPASHSRLAALRRALDPRRLVARHRHGDGTGAGDDDEEEEEGEGEGFDLQDEDEEDMHAAGVPAARGWRLDARQMETPAFRARVLDMFAHQLKLAGWADADVPAALSPLQPERVGLKRVSGAFSNVVIFASYSLDGIDAGTETLTGPPTVLLRVYGTATEVLLSRRAELLILHTLSSLYEIGPHILGTFANGRVEEYFDCVPIGKDGMRDLGTRSETIVADGSLLVRGVEGRAQWAARRMRELHEVPLEPIRTVLEQGDLRAPSDKGFGRGIERHLFARAHRPRRPQPVPTQNAGGSGSGYFGEPPSASSTSSAAAAGGMRDSPAPMTPPAPFEATSIAAAAAAGARAQALEIRGASPKNRNNSVTSFDSLATSYSSTASFSSDTMRSPMLRGADSYIDSVSAARRGSSGVLSRMQPPTPRHRGSGSASYVPYPGVWRRTKRWSREAAKVLALVDDFAMSAEGREACARALADVPFRLSASLPGGEGGSGAASGDTTMRTSRNGSAHSSDSGHMATPSAQLACPTAAAIGSTATLQNMLLAISAIDFGRLVLEMDAFKQHVRAWERAEGQSKRVLTHGDTQYGNLLIRKSMDPERPVASGMPRTNTGGSVGGAQGAASPALGADKSRSRSKGRKARMAPHERLVVIDMEYLNHGPRAYDIANMFIEWGADYDHPTDSWNMTINGPYPSADERRRWLRAYAEQGRLMRMRGKAPLMTPAVAAGSTSLVDGSRRSPTPASTPASTPAVPAGAEVPPPIAALPPPLVPLQDGGASSSSAASRSTAATPASSRSSSLSPRVGPADSSAASSPALSLNGAPATPSATTAASSLARLDASLEREVERLEREVRVWRPASHAVWALWGITFARERLEVLLARETERVRRRWAGEAEADEEEVKASAPGSAESFDNLRYALGRVEMFRAAIAELGITL